MTKMSKFGVNIIVMVVFFSLATIGVYFIWTYASRNAVPGTVNTILKYLDKGGQLRDPTNDIGVSSIDDVGYVLKGNNLTIMFGKIRIKLGDWKKINDRTKHSLLRIGLTLKYSEELGLKVFYKGKAVKELGEIK